MSYFSWVSTVTVRSGFQFSKWKSWETTREPGRSSASTLFMRVVIMPGSR
jgi:hypothetical protein